MTTEQESMAVASEAAEIGDQLKAQGGSEMAVWLAAFVHYESTVNGRTEFAASELLAAWENYQQFIKDEAAA